jgi:hypothetical protein
MLATFTFVSLATVSRATSTSLRACSSWAATIAVCVFCLLVRSFSTSMFAR